MALGRKIAQLEADLTKIRRVLASKKETATPARFVDLAVFSSALGTYKAWLDEQEAGPDAHYKKGVALARRYSSQLTECIDEFVAPLGERPDAGVLRPVLLQARRGGSPADVADRQGSLVESSLLWLRRKQAVFHDIFPARPRRSATQLAQALSEDNVQARLNKLAVIPVTSGLRAPRQWIEKAAEAVGVLPSEGELAKAQAEGAEAIVEEIRKESGALQGYDPSDAAYADHAARKEHLENALQDSIDSSVYPGVVAASAAANLASDPLPKILNRVPMDDEKVAALVSKGRVRIAAGAGSGKTRVLVAKIVYSIEELGYQPHQVWATSFSKKSAAEIHERLKTYGGDLLASEATRAGKTTHSIAGSILRDFRKDLEGMKHKAGDIASGKLPFIKLAMKQVELTREGTVGDLPDESVQLIRLIDELIPLTSYDNFLQRFLPSIKDQLKKGRTLSPKQLAILKRNLDRQGIDDGGMIRTAAAKGKKSRFWNDPARQWFNLGEKLEDERGRPIGSKRFSTVISNFKGDMIGPEQAWDEHQGTPGLMRVAAAVYGAYEWLKKNDEAYGPAMDFDDWLLKAVEVLQTDARARETIQRQAKVVLVDEAQDLNAAQHKFFSIVAEKADTFCFIGDDKQCVAVDTPILTPVGEVRAGNLKPGDEVLSYRNGEIVPQRVRHVVESSWARGFRIRTEDGRDLLMSPNHKIWATEPRTNDGQVAVYLMYRRDKGFRVGITNKGKTSRGEGYLNSYGGRAFLEKAERMWILDICDNREQALLLEEQYSLRFGIPTNVFSGEHRDLDQDRIDKIFQEFGGNGARLLEHANLSFQLPHWMSQSYSKHGRDRRTVNVNAHSSQKTQVALEWSGDEFDEDLQILSPSSKGSVFRSAGDRRRLRRYFDSYRDAMDFAGQLAEITRSNLSERLSTPDGMLRLITASGLFPGMEVAVFEDGAMSLDRIVSVEEDDGEFVDLDVDDASNFFGGGVLSHNSIYEFRGARPENFVDLDQEGFSDLQLKKNFRSGSSIVDAANKLIAHNDRQIPMVCEPARADEAVGEIKAVAPATHEEGAEMVAEEISQAVESGTMKPSDFGVAVRNNAELDAFCLALIAKGIPFRSKFNFFDRPQIKNLTAWMEIANDKSVEEVNKAILQAYKAPKSNLDKMFEQRLREVASGQDYLEFLVEGGWKEVYDYNNAWRNERYVLPYMENLVKIRGVGQGKQPSEVLNLILELQGAPPRRDVPGKSMMDSLVDSLSADDLDEIAASEGTLEASEEAVREAALAPIRPLRLLLESKDGEGIDAAMNFIGRMQRANAKVSKKDDPDAKDYDEPAVQLATVHTWKGLEAPNVYTVMAKGVFPYERRPTREEMAAGIVPEPNPEELESERRLAYVALTRGQDSVTVITPAVNYRGQDSGMSQFVAEACISYADDSARPVTENPDNPSSKVASHFGHRFGSVLEEWLDEQEYGWDEEEGD